MAEVTEQMRQWAKDKKAIDSKLDNHEVRIDKLEKKEVKQENITPVTPISIRGVVYTPVVPKAPPTLNELANDLIILVVCILGLCWLLGL